MKPWKISSILFNSFFERNPIKTKSTSGRAVLNWPVEYIVKTQLKNYIINVCDVWNAGTFFSHFSVNFITNVVEIVYLLCYLCVHVMLIISQCIKKFAPHCLSFLTLISSPKHGSIYIPLSFLVFIVYWPASLFI